MALLVRLAFVVLVLGGYHLYIWWRAVSALQGLPFVLCTTLVALAPVLLISRMLLSRLLPKGGVRWLTWPVYLWMGSSFVLLTSLMVEHGAQALAAVSLSPADPSRLWLLSNGIGLTLVWVVVISAYSLYRGLGPVEVRRVEVELARLPAALSGIRIVQLTDVHIGQTIGAKFLARIVRQVNALEPDVVVITGDLVDGPVETLKGGVAPLEALEARYGVYFVTGNHEYYSGAPEWCEHLTTLGIRVLRNERVAISLPGEASSAFDLAGIDDYSAHHFGNGHGADLEKALQGRDPARELVLLAHQPRAIEEAAAQGVGLQLSGHTHGGQIWPFHYLVRLQQPKNAGLSRFGDTQLYISRGTGYWGPPMRFGAPAEITEVILRANRAASG